MHTHTKVNPKWTELLYIPPMVVPVTSASRPQCAGTYPGRLHHRCHGGVLCTAHRRGQGSIPSPDEPGRCGPSLQRHHAGLQAHLPERGLSWTLERCHSEIIQSMLLVCNYKCVSQLLSSAFFRHAAQHHKKCTSQLHGAGYIRPDQGGHPEAQTHVR